MKKILIGVVGLGVVWGIFYFTKNDTVVPPVAGGTIELCFAKNGVPNERGYADKYTLSMSLDGGQVMGELKLLPAEKDSKVGKFSGTVSAVDRVMMARTVDAVWDTLAEGMNTQEQLRIIFGEGTASIGFGEMVDRGDGVYVYKDLKSISYNLDLTDVACDQVK
jgi:hypothetical protein